MHGSALQGSKKDVTATTQTSFVKGSPWCTSCCLQTFHFSILKPVRAKEMGR